MMIAGGMWSAYEMRKAMNEAQAKAKANRGGLKSTTKTSERPIPVVYGLTRAGGNILYQHSGGQRDDDSQQRNRYLNTIIGVSEGPIEGFKACWINDTKIWEATSGMTNIDSGFLDTPFLTKCRFFTTNVSGQRYSELDFRLGCNSQQHFTQINCLNPLWGWDLKGNWVQNFDTDFSDSYPMTAVAFSRLFYKPDDDGNVIFQGMPNITYEVYGKKVRDIHGDINSLIWTDNPAHILFDVLTNKQYGWSIPSSKIDLASFQAVGSFTATSLSAASAVSTLSGAQPFLHVGNLGPEPVTDWWTFNPTSGSFIGGRTYLIDPASAGYDASSFIKTPFVAGSVEIHPSMLFSVAGVPKQITYRIADDGAGNLHFAGYRYLGNGITGISGLYLPTTTGFPGGDISSGTNVGSIDYDTGEISFLVTSIEGNIDGGTYTFYPSSMRGGSAQWFYGYGLTGQAVIAAGQLTPGTLTLVATMSDNSVEMLTETFSGSGIFVSSSLSGGLSTGGGVINYGGTVSYYFTEQPALLPVLTLEYAQYYGYSYNGILLDASPAVDVVRDICQHFRGYLTYKQGIYFLNVDGPGTPVYAFDEDNIKVGSFVIRQTPISERPNRIRVKYTDRSQDYAPMDVVYEPPNPIISTDEVVIEHTISLEKCVYRDQAYRMAQTLGLQAQLGNTCEFITGQDGLNVDVGDLITVTWNPAGWVDKIFRIAEMEERPDEEVSLSCVEYDESVYVDTYTG